MNVPFLDLPAHHAPLRADLDRAIARVIEASAFSGGVFVEEFEEAFARYCTVPHAVGTASGTDALWLALAAAGIGPGDEVITVAHTFIATASAIVRAGATPVFVDVDADTGTMDPDAFAAAITPRTRAVLPVHLFGLPAAMDVISAIAMRHGLFVLEDACQAHGAHWRNRRVGAWGHAAALSFYPGKNLGAFGDAGAVVTSDPELAATLRMLRDHGRTTQTRHECIGANSRMAGIQAAVLSVKLPRLDAANAARRRAAALYARALEDVDAVERPYLPREATPVHHLYAIQVEERDELLAALRTRGIGCAVHYPTPIHLQPAFAHFGYEAGELPVTERRASRLLSLPMFPEITPGQIAHVAESIAAHVGGEVFA